MENNPVFFHLAGIFCIIEVVLSEQLKKINPKQAASSLCVQKRKCYSQKSCL